MLFKRSYLLLLVIILLLSVACQSNSPSQLPLTQTPVSITGTPQPTATPAPAAVSNKGWDELLSYISLEWLNTHNTESPIGSVLYLSDLAQLRADLKLPSVTGADDHKAKLPLLTKLPATVFEWANPDHFKQWGWDIADVQQIAYLWDDYIRLIRGDFARPEIKQRFLDQGYAESQLGEFSIFTKAGPRVDQYAWKPDTIIISSRETALKSLIQRKMEGRVGLDQHPVIARVLQRLDGTWSALLATVGSADVAQRTLDNVSTIDPDLAKAFKEKWPEMLTSDFEFGWDSLAIGWKGAKPDVALTIMYHYPSTVEAEKDTQLLKKTLTDNPSFSSRVELWSDKLNLQTTEADGEFLIAKATARTDNTFITAITNRDFTFLPVRTVPRTASPTPTLVRATKAITSPYGSGWTLYTNEREGFAVALPPKWAQINLDPDVLEAGVQMLQEQNPGLLQGDQARRAAASGVKFMGFDVSPAGRTASFQVEVSVMRADLPRGSTLDSIVSQIMQQLDKVTTIVQPVEHQRVQLKAGEAERLQATQKLALPSGKELSLDEIQYYFVQGNSLYVLALVAPSKYSKNYTETFEQITNSFQFVK